MLIGAPGAIHCWHPGTGNVRQLPHQRASAHHRGNVALHQAHQGDLKGRDYGTARPGAKLALLEGNFAPAEALTSPRMTVHFL